MGRVPECGWPRFRFWRHHNLQQRGNHAQSRLCLLGDNCGSAGRRQLRLAPPTLRTPSPFSMRKFLAQTDAVNLSILAFIWIAGIMIVFPKGNFPLNDDLSFAISSKRLLEEGHFRPTGCTSMSLLAQTLSIHLLRRFITSRKRESPNCSLPRKHSRSP